MKEPEKKEITICVGFGTGLLIFILVLAIRTAFLDAIKLLAG